MNALVKKEIRLLLPSFLIGCVLAFSSRLWREGDGTFDSMLELLPFVICPAVAVMMALNSFGVEISSGTFASLLAQPVSRQKIWQTKILLLAMALLIVASLWVGSFWFRNKFIQHPRSAGSVFEWFECAMMFALAVFSGGLWTVLLLRQVAAAFWFTVLVPGVLIVVLAGLLAGESDEFVNGMVISVLGLYSLAGFFFARWLFFRAQDVQWSGGAIAMPEMRGLARFKIGSGTRRLWRPRMALFVKELQLHQAQFLIAGVLALLHLGVLVTRHFGHFRKNSTTEFILESIWMLWLVMPLLVGCAAVAEERKLGTLEGQLCLPMKSRTQFAMKLFVALGLAVALGVVMPLLLEGARILPDVHFKLISFFADNDAVYGLQLQMPMSQIFFWDCLEQIDRWLPLLTLAAIAILIGGISFYVSSLMRNTLQTLAPALAGIVAAWFLIFIATIPGELDIDYLWHGPLPYFIVLPAMVLTLLALACRNYQSVLTGWKMGRHNLLVLASVLALTVAATSAIYHRAWEKFTPFEPPHGAARLSLSNPAGLSYERNEISVRFPDGKIWMVLLMPDLRINLTSLMLANFKMYLNDGQFIGGSNWLTMKPSMWDLVGIKTDGTLWVSEKPWTRLIWVKGQYERDNEVELKHLVQFGTDTNWNILASQGYSVLLTKTDGTLWRWGATNLFFGARTNRWPGLRTFTPKRLGTESNWAELFQIDYQTYLRKTDGTIWSSSDYYGSTNGHALLEIEPGFTLVKTSDNQAQARFRSTAWISHGLQYKIGIRDDGTFRIWSHELLTTNSGQTYGSYDWFPTDSQIGTGTNWLAVTGSFEKIVTLKSDGSLWLWNFHRSHSWEQPGDQYRFKPEILKTVPVRLGTHSDWIAIAGYYDAIIAIAADGSLWYWPLERSDEYNDYGDDSHFEPLLDISHKPQYLGNIFAKPD
jgi:ABC-type transport system involved in multi-copper enzyme maturation permease subunit